MVAHSTTDPPLSLPAVSGSEQSGGASSRIAERMWFSARTGVRMHIGQARWEPEGTRLAAWRSSHQGRLLLWYIPLFLCRYVHSGRRYAFDSRKRLLSRLAQVYGLKVVLAELTYIQPIDLVIAGVIL